MPRTAPAIAVATSQRKNSPPRSSLSRIVSVTTGRPAEGLTLHRHDALALLACALRDELLDPVAEGRDLRRRDERDLVATLRREAAHHRAEPHTRIALDRHRVGAGVPHLHGPLQH